MRPEDCTRDLAGPLIELVVTAKPREGSGPGDTVVDERWLDLTRLGQSDHGLDTIEPSFHRLPKRLPVVPLYVVPDPDSMTYEPLEPTEEAYFGRTDRFGHGHPRAK